VRRSRPSSTATDVFTGLVREVGRVLAFRQGRLTVEAPATAGDTQVGDSVAIDGVCLTVVAVDGSTFGFDAVPETLARTALSTLDRDSSVNLEPSLRAGEPLGGHYVQGHVDGVATVRSISPEGDSRRIWFDTPAGLLRYVVEKGSIAVQGASLTVAAVDGAGFAVALIPHTLEVTTFGALAVGDRVNLEVDVLAKYVEKLLRASL
jgi:riboflavin synthase